jgi:hypothetical protein
LATKKKTTTKRAAKKTTTKRAKKAQLPSDVAVALTKVAESLGAATKKPDEVKPENFKTFIVTMFPKMPLESTVQLTNSALYQELHRIIGRSVNTVFNLTNFARWLPKLKDAREDCKTTDALETLMDTLEPRLEPILKEMRMRVGLGRVAFEDLHIIFAEGCEVVSETNYGLSGGIVVSCDVSYSFFGARVRLGVKHISVEKGDLREHITHFTIGEYSGEKTITELAVRPLTPEMREALTIRGRKFVETVTKPSYVYMTGNQFRRSWWSLQQYNAVGRAVIDAKMMHRMDPEYFRGGYDPEGEEKLDHVEESKLWMCAPVVYGFSFVTKKWGEFAVDHVTPVQFDKHAFETLVLEKTKKQLVLSLVEHHGSGFKDVIQGKGGGCIFLLHGEPGVGKTLTAEAVAELLERPLYMVSIGELGTDPQQLEESLRQILDLSVAWNAVILLDEADIFLEARDEKDILRNAMVGVFLRLLEYHQGVMFLTSNRAKNIDKAFLSRISVALKYQSMSTDIRKQVWTNLLKAASVEGLDVETLAGIPLNGRQIKNAIRLAQTLAKRDNRNVVASDVLDTVKIAEQFEKDVHD